MPTGYTQMILDGKVKTPKEFLHLCLRNFGVCICMRDDSFDVDMDYSPRIKEHYTEDIEYHQKYLKSAENKMEEILKLTDEHLYRRYLAVNNKKEVEGRIKQYTEINQKYDDFVEVIKKWDCDPEFNNIKKFAIEQLESSKESIRWCEEELDEMGDTSWESFLEKKDEFIEDLKKDIQWEIDYHKKEMEASTQRMKETLDFYHRFKEEINKLEQ